MKLLWISRYRGNLNGYRPEGEILIDLSRMGIDITFMGIADDSYLQRIRDHGIHVVPFRPARHKLDWRAMRAIRTELKRERYDIVQAFQGAAIACLLMASFGIPVKVVAYRGQTGNIYRHDPYSYLTMLHPRLDAIICVAQSVEDDLRQRVWHADRPKLTTIYKGHDLAWYDYQKSDRAALNIPDDAFILGFAANIRPRKGIHVLIEASYYLPKELNLHILLMGHGTDKKAILDECGKTPYADRFHCLGFREDVMNLVAMCDATTLPTTKREGFSRSIVESQAMAIPAIVSNTGGNAEIVADGETGLVVPPRDAKALAAAIVTLYQDRQRARDMGQQARQRIHRCFSHEQTVTQYFDFYHSLLN